MFDSVQQSSGCLIKIPSVTAAHVFVYDSALLKGRHDILFLRSLNLVIFLDLPS